MTTVQGRQRESCERSGKFKKLSLPTREQSKAVDAFVIRAPLPSGR
jgi:hypothetical protein